MQEHRNYLGRIEYVENLSVEAKDLYEIIVDDPSLYEEFEEEALRLCKVYEQSVDDLELYLLFSNEFDQKDVILEIHPGAGGTESTDWAEMLFRMYIRFCEQKGYSYEVLEYLPGDVAGIKSVSIRISGSFVYGHLKAERGVHRLVRISPFDSANRRHTSFASVEVIPELDLETEVELKQEDLKIDTYRASGAGGQHVNTTDSAVRITHVPTNIVVSCQSERSQIKNRERALKVLATKLVAKQHEENKETLSELTNDQREIAWGSQIRSYVLHPYSLVKDTRTGYEETNPSKVLDGQLDNFIKSYLLYTYQNTEKKS